MFSPYDKLGWKIIIAFTLILLILGLVFIEMNISPFYIAMALVLLGVIYHIVFHCLMDRLERQIILKYFYDHQGMSLPPKKLKEAEFNIDLMLKL